jgi:predicted P-loop ATPase
LRLCIDSVARACRRHSVRDYFDALPPGDPSVLDSLASEWFGAHEPLDQELLKRFLVASVRRILTPGTKVDTMLVLYGDQGFKKSQWISALFSGGVPPPVGKIWSREQMPDLTKTADSSNAIATTWAQEFPELDKLLRADPATAKDFLSRVVDHYRPAYGRTFLEKARQCVFIGTTNEREFLRDPTGERRYWIIEVAKKINPELVIAMRDAVWAAAYALAMRPEYKHYFETGDEWDVILKLRQENYSKGDGWTDAILDFVSGKEAVNISDIVRDCICKGDAAWLTKFDDRVRNRIVAILRRSGCTQDPRSRAVYRVPDVLRTRKPSEGEAARRRLTGGNGNLLTLMQGGQA